MNHRDRDAHRKGFSMTSRGYRPLPPKRTLWQSIVGKLILLIVGSIFALALIKAFV